MRVAIDASRITVRQRTGTENYALQLLRELIPQNTHHQITLYFRDTPPPDLLPPSPLVTHHIIPFRRGWTHSRFAWELWRNRYDWVWVPAHTLPFAFPGKALVTIHDLGYKYFPEAHPTTQRLYLDITTRYSAWRATHILADSIATQADLHRHYKTPLDKITVVYPGVDESLHPTVLTDTIRQKYDLPARYLLFIGTLQPRKNIARLVQAFVQWQQASDQQDVVLALGGKAGWLFDPAWVAGFPNVRMLGYIADEDIAALYSGALGLVMPSLFEGFGFPVLEAMRCGTPVLCSNTSSLPELAGDAAILVDPEAVDSIADGIRQLVEDAALRQKLVERGNQQAQKFTWRQAATQVLYILDGAHP